jgi:hypothetical protein
MQMIHRKIEKRSRRMGAANGEGVVGHTYSLFWSSFRPRLDVFRVAIRLPGLK